MDSITHTIAGALVGKAFYGGQRGPEAPDGMDRSLPWVQTRRVAVFAATLGAVFPDLDIFFALFDRGRQGAGLELHRGVTHSFVCLPVFAVALALLTRWYTRRRNIAAPSLPKLVLIYATGLALHIFLDLFTSYGTMIWSPLSWTRAAWDLTFIIDFTLSAIVLTPQVLAWVHRQRKHALRLRVGGWALFTLGAMAVYAIARAAGYAFSAAAVPVISVLFAALFFLPALRGWGHALPRRTWCRAGVAVLAIYIGMQAVAHQRALAYVQEFAASRRLQVETLGALPLAPSLLRWSGLIRTPEGVYYTRFTLPSAPPEFRFAADAPANGYIAAARQAPVAKRFLWFARFPLIAYARRDSLHYVDFSDMRFMRAGARPFALRVTLDDAGRVLAQRWTED